MSLYNRVAWTDGMFLLPQHFQQAERYREQELSLRLTHAFPLAWGILELQLDELAVSQGRVVISRCKAVFPDGTTVDAPNIDPVPTSRTFKLGADIATLEVYLTVPVQKKRAPLSAASSDRADIKYVRSVEDAPDEHEPSRSQPVEVLVPNLRLALTGESLDGLVAIKVGEIIRGRDGSPMYNKDFVPPALSVRASTMLHDLAKDILGEMVSRARTLADKQAHLGKGLIEFTSTDVLSFWFLHTLNLHIPVVRDLVDQAGTHPAELFRELLRLAGGLSTFDQTHAGGLPCYTHDRIGPCFAELDGRLRTLLRKLFQSPYEVLPFEREKDFWVGEVSDKELLTSGRFVMVVTADMPIQQIVEQFPKACKISEVSGIEELVTSHVGGVRISHLPNPPPALPGVEGACYFYIQTTGTDWDKIKNSGKLAAYVPSWLPGVNIKLVGVRPRRNS